MLTKYKSYKDYVQKPICVDKLAPLTARPKNSKGDNPGFRTKLKHLHSKGSYLKSEVPFHHGQVNVSMLKRIKKREVATDVRTKPSTTNK